MMVALPGGTNLEYTETNFVRVNNKVRDDYKDPSLTPSRYRYRVAIDNFDLNLETEIKEWCEKNCLRRFEMLKVRTGLSRFTLVTSFEKKIDCMAFKLRWA